MTALHLSLDRQLFFPICLQTDSYIFIPICLQTNSSSSASFRGLTVVLPHVCRQTIIRLHLSADRQLFVCICPQTEGGSSASVYRQAAIAFVNRPTAIRLHPYRKTDILLHRDLRFGRRLFFCTVYRKTAICLHLSTEWKILACLCLQTHSYCAYTYASVYRQTAFCFPLAKIDNLVCICLQTLIFICL